MQEVRRFKPSTVSRRFSVTAGFYRTCVIDGVLEHSPAEHARRPVVPAELPTLGFTHLQFEAPLTAARQSANRNDFALVAMPGLLGLRIFESTCADIDDLGEEHGHRVLRVCGKGSKVVLVPQPRQWAGPSTVPSAAAVPGRSCSTTAAREWTGMRPPAGSDCSPERLVSRSPGHILICSGTRSSRPCSTQALTCATSRSPPPCRPSHHDALRPCSQEPRPSPQLHPRRLHGLRHLNRT
jgi:integrase/recombinase XerD